AVGGTDYLVRMFRARALLALGRAEEARTEAEEMVRLLPQRIWPRALRAEALHAAGRPAEALAEYEAVLSDAPDVHFEQALYRHVLDRLARAALDAGRPERAAAALELLAFLTPDGGERCDVLKRRAFLAGVDAAARDAVLVRALRALLTAPAS